VRAHVEALSFYNGVVRRIVLDNLAPGAVKPDIYDPKLNQAICRARRLLRVSPATREGRATPQGQAQDRVGSGLHPPELLRRPGLRLDRADDLRGEGAGPWRWQGGGPREPWRSHPCRGLLH